MLEICPVFDSRAQVLAENDSFQFDSTVIKWRLVGKHDWTGQLLICWHKQPDSKEAKTDKVASDSLDVGINISIFDPTTKEAEIIFSSEEYYDIFQCSVDQAKTRLAFVCRTTQTCQIQSTDFGSNVEDEERFMCFWTLLNTGTTFNCVCPLNNEIPCEIRVHFLSSVQLVAFVLQEGIFLYTLPSNGDSRKTSVSSPIFYEKLCGPFPWAQWDIIAGRIFYLQFRRPQRSNLSNWATDDTSEDTSCVQLCPFLVGLQFHPDSVLETLLNMPLETLIIQDPESEVDNSSCCNSGKKCNPLSNRISELTLGLQLQVFLHSNGSASICQGIIQERLNGKRSSNGCENEFLEISYSVALLHHGCTLHCKVEVYKYNSKFDFNLMFAPWEDGILVLVPGLFTHLLDVGLYHEPSNHILYSECVLPAPEVDGFYDCWNYETLGTSELYVLIASNFQMCLFNLSITSRSLLKTLKSFSSNRCISSNIHLAILHQIMLHHSDFSDTEVAMDHLLKVVQSPQITKLFQEFLLGGSFAGCKGHIEDRFVSLLPVSSSPPLEILKETDSSKGMHTSVTYTTLLKDVKSMLLSPNERHVPRRKMTDSWTLLWNHLKSHRTSTRFSAKSLRDRLLTMGKLQEFQNLKPFASASHQQSTSSSLQRETIESANFPFSICQRILNIAAELGRMCGGFQLLNFNLHFHSSFTESSSTDENDDYSSTSLQQMVALNVREVTVHFMKCLAGEDPCHIDDAACTYVANRMHQSQLLCHIIFQSVNVKLHFQGPHLGSQPYAFLNEIPITTCKRLFAILKCYLLAVEQLCFPRPEGFDTFFSVLAYRCLNFNTFLRYTDYGIVQLTSEVLQCISVSQMNTHPGEKSVATRDEIAMEIITRLPRQQVLYFLKQWNPPSLRIARMHSIVEQHLHHCILSDKRNEDDADKTLSVSSESNLSKNKMAAVESDQSSQSDDASRFIPKLPASVIKALNCFMLHLEQEKAHQESSENPATSFSHLSNELELVKKTQLRNIARHCHRRLQKCAR